MFMEFNGNGPFKAENYVEFIYFKKCLYVYLRYEKSTKKLRFSTADVKVIFFIATPAPDSNSQNKLLILIFE